MSGGAPAHRDRFIQGAVRYRRGLLGVPPSECVGGHAHRSQLDPAVLLAPGDLTLDRGAESERNGNELPDVALTRIDPVEPRLVGQAEVVLRIGFQRLGPALATDGAHLANANLKGRRFVGVEREPHGLALIDGQHHPAACEPLRRDGVGIVLDAAQGKSTQSRR